MKLLNKLKEFFNIKSDGCRVLDCYQGRNCSCCSTPTISFGDAIREVHRLGTRVPDADMGRELRRIGDRLAQLGNQHQEGIYKPVEPPKTSEFNSVKNSVYDYNGLEGTNH